MSRTTGAEFRRAGSYDISQPSPVILGQTLKSLCFTYGFNTVRTELHGLADELGISPAAVQEPQQEHDASPAHRVGRRGKPITAKRSAGAQAAWATRNAVKEYMREHPDVSREAALEAVRESQGKTRVTEVPPDSQGRRAWAKRVDKVIDEYRENGQEITRDQAHKIVGERMRTGKTKKAA